MKSMRRLKNSILAVLTAVLFVLLPMGGVNRSVCAKPLFSSTSGTIHNIVLFVNFADTPSFTSSEYVDKMNEMYNTSDIGLKTYISEVSKGLLDVETHFLTDKNANADITVEKNRSYYLPKYRYDERTKKYAETNSDGYDNRYFLNGRAVAPDTDGALKSIDGFYREQTLLREVISLVDDSEINCNLDNNGDGYLDSISFILNTSTTSADYNELIWPHMSSLYSYGNAVKNSFYIPTSNTYDFSLMKKTVLGDTEVRDYDLLSYGFIENVTLSGKYSHLSNVGVICHEFMHTLGLMDYYAYDGDEVESVGEFDVMSTTTAIPQYPLSYIRGKMGWLKEGEDIMPITGDGKYTLSPVTSASGAAGYKIVLDDYFTTGEYFMLEVRSRTDTGGKFDSMISDSGLIVYRVNEKNAFYNSSLKTGTYDYGNMYGAEEVFVIRCGNNQTINNRTYSLALYNGNVVSDGFTLYDKSELGLSDLSLTVDTVKELNNLKKKTLINYSDGSNSGIALKNITENSDGTISFEINLPETVGDGLFLKPELKKHYDGTNKIVFNPQDEKSTCHIAVVKYNEKALKQAKAGTLYTAEQIINDEIDGLILKDSIPACFKEYKLGQISQEAMIFVVFEGKGGASDVYYAGALNHLSKKDSFWQFLKNGCGGC